MGNILTTTDFSVNAGYAVNYAACMASGLHNRLTLFHAYHMPAPEDAGILAVDTLAQWQKDSMRGLTKIAEHLTGCNASLEVETQSVTGLAAEEIVYAANSGKYEMLVIGSRGAGTDKKNIFGNVVSDVLEECRIPVLVIPPGFTYKLPKKIALACHKENLLTPKTIETVTAFVKMFDAHLFVIDIVKDPGINLLSEHDDGSKIGLDFKELDHSVHIVQDDSVAHGINQFRDENEIDLMIIIHEKHTLFERLFTRLHTSSIARETHGPLLIVHKG